MTRDGPTPKEIKKFYRRRRRVGYCLFAVLFFVTFLTESVLKPDTEGIWRWFTRPHWLEWADSLELTQKALFVWAKRLGYFVALIVVLPAVTRRDWRYEHGWHIASKSILALSGRKTSKSVILVGFPDEVKVHAKGAEVRRLPPGVLSLLRLPKEDGDLVVFYPNPCLLRLPKTPQDRRELADFVRSTNPKTAKVCERSNHPHSRVIGRIREAWFAKILSAKVLSSLNELTVDSTHYCGHVMIFIPGDGKSMDAFTRRIWRRWTGMRWPGALSWRNIPVQLKSWLSAPPQAPWELKLVRKQWVTINGERSVVADLAIEHIEKRGSLVPITLRPPWMLPRLWHAFRREFLLRWTLDCGILEAIDYRYPGVLGWKLNKGVVTPLEDKLDPGVERAEPLPPVSIRQSVHEMEWPKMHPVAFEMQFPQTIVHLLPELEDTGRLVESVADALFHYGIRRYRPGLDESPDRDCFAPYTHKNLPGWERARAEVERLLGSKTPRQTTPQDGALSKTMAGRSAAFLSMLPNILDAIQNEREHVLVYGPTGSGKERVYDVLRRTCPAPSKFVVVDLAHVEGSWVDSDIFGHEEGAFTGAVGKRDGLVARAEGGTLVLDNVQNATQDLQAKILRLLEPNQEYRCLGSDEIRKANCRIVAGFNRAPRELVEAEKLLPDWLARFGIEINVPSLDCRVTDIPLLVKEIAHRYGQDCNIDVTPALEALLGGRRTMWAWERKSWAEQEGNVRGLRKEVRRYLRNWRPPAQRTSDKPADEAAPSETPVTSPPDGQDEAKATPRKKRGRVPTLSAEALVTLLRDAAQANSSWDELRQRIRDHPSGKPLSFKGPKEVLRRVESAQDVFGPELVSYVKSLQLANGDRTSGSKRAGGE